jgi:hypothetical protein
VHLLKNLSLAFFLLAVAAVVGCGGNNSAVSATASPSPTPAPPPSPPPPPPPPPSPGPSASPVSITSPANGASVTMQFNLSATAPTCSSQTVNAIGYSLDASSDQTIVNGASVNTQITAAAGQHTVNVQAWGTGGASCTGQSVFTVTDTAGGATSNIPSDANSVSGIQALSGWTAIKDPGTPGSSSGAMSVVATPSLSGQAREFQTSFKKSGGERYAVSFGSDTTSANFFYDAWVYLTSSASNIANLELDVNQVMDNGQTVIFGFQCDGYSGTWDYTANHGTPMKYNGAWVHSNAACNLSDWSRNTWHHIQISYSRDDSGNVTYQSVWLDSVEQNINATVPSAFELGWAPMLLTNFQVDGYNSGADTVYLDQLTVYRW